MSINIQTAQPPRSKSELRDAFAEAEYNIELQARAIGNYEALRTWPYDWGVWHESNLWHDRLNSLRSIDVSALPEGLPPCSK